MIEDPKDQKYFCGKPLEVNFAHTVKQKQKCPGAIKQSKNRSSVEEFYLSEYSDDEDNIKES